VSTFWGTVQRGSFLFYGRLCLLGVISARHLFPKSCISSFPHANQTLPTRSHFPRRPFRLATNHWLRLSSLFLKFFYFLATLLQFLQSACLFVLRFSFSHFITSLLDHLFDFSFCLFQQFF